LLLDDHLFVLTLSLVVLGAATVAMLIWTALP
jgi:hypothetical protein